MTKQELEQRTQSEKNRLAILIAMEAILVEQAGREAYQAKVDQALDNILKYRKQLEKLNRKA